ncbi:hypothetical protein [Paraglaciecola sp. 2405UD69-4]|uniref:hypothetical protein n=1 Tax=Paraglaciecola sp. 2405UD69-4 TaxID=3391836 RepID=UPI0039C9A221
MKLTITSQAYFSHPRTMSNKALRQQVKDDFDVAVRRMDNFTLSGLAAIAKLNLDIANPEKVSLVSCAPYFSVELVQKLIIDCQNGKSIRPLDFVSTVGNAANFYIAKEFEIHGSNLFLGAGTNAIDKALMVSAIELASKVQQKVVILFWQETPTERSCYAMLAENPVEEIAPIVTDLSFENISQASYTIPYTLDLQHKLASF